MFKFVLNAQSHRTMVVLRTFEGSWPVLVVSQTSGTEQLLVSLKSESFAPSRWCAAIVCCVHHPVHLAQY